MEFPTDKAEKNFSNLQNIGENYTKGDEEGLVTQRVNKNELNFLPHVSKNYIQESNQI